MGNYPSCSSIQNRGYYRQTPQSLNYPEYYPFIHGDPRINYHDFYHQSNKIGNKKRRLQEKQNTKNEQEKKKKESKRKRTEEEEAD
jgi:hypothetical protein